MPILLTRAGWTTSIFRINGIFTFWGCTLPREIKDFTLVTITSLAGIIFIGGPALSILVNLVSFVAFVTWRCSVDDHHGGSKCLRWTHGAAMAGELDGIVTVWASTGLRGAERYSILTGTGDTCIALPRLSCIVMCTILFCAAG